LILLFVVLLIYGGGYAYMHFVLKPQIEELETENARLESQYNSDFQTAEMLPALRVQLEESQAFIENYDKTIFPNNNPDEVFRFLTLLNRPAGLTFNYVFQDSTITEDFGIIRSEVTGTGPYRGLMRFINAIEHSEPVQKVSNVSISPLGLEEGYQNVSFVFQVESNYDSQDLFSAERLPGTAVGTLASAHNPFFPLIRNVEPNTENLPNVDNSRLIGMTSGSVFLRDQNGQMVTLRLNDRVYLGRLESINAREGRVTFRLNRGGIIDVVTLEVQR
jgi:Tfp pilus assembly protein PilO